MKQKDFFRAVQAKFQVQYGYGCGSSLVASWMYHAQKTARFTDADVDAAVAHAAAICAQQAARPKTLVYNPAAGDGFGLWQEVVAE